MPRFYTDEKNKIDLEEIIEESSKPKETPIYTITLILIFCWFLVGLVSSGIIANLLMVIILLLLLKQR